MKKAEITGFCARLEGVYEGEEGGDYFRHRERGSTMYFGAAYPTIDSRGSTACARLLDITMDSFLGRPAVIDEAMIQIAGFAARSIYALQKPGEEAFAHGAVLFLHKGSARFLLSGSAKGCLYEDRKKICEFGGEDAPLIGSSLRRMEDPLPALELGSGLLEACLCAGPGTVSFPEEKAEGSLRNFMEGLYQEREGWVSLLGVQIGSRQKKGLF